MCVQAGCVGYVSAGVSLWCRVTRLAADAGVRADGLVIISLRMWREHACVDTAARLCSSVCMPVCVPRLL